jgi:hypothetical protein
MSDAVKKYRGPKPADQWTLGERDAFRRGLLGAFDSLLKLYPDRKWIHVSDIQVLREAVAKKRP